MSRVFVLGLLLSAAAAAETEPPLRYPYWQMITEINGTIEEDFPRPASVSDNNRRNEYTYPFEMFRHLYAADILQAAREGALVARLQAGEDASDAEIEALVLRNVAVALEYLPMLIQRDEDIDELALLLAKRDEDDVLRLYLLQNTYPGFSPVSLLSVSLSELIDMHDDNYNKWTLQVATHPRETPQIQCVALQIYYARLCRDYERALRADPAVRAFMDGNEHVHPHTVIQENALELAMDTTTALRQIRRRAHEFASAIAGHIAEGSVRDEQVKDITRDILTDMRENIDGINKAQIDAYLAGKAQGEMAFPSMPMPTAQPQMPMPMPMPSQTQPQMPDPNQAPLQKEDIMRQIPTQLL